MRLLPAGAYYAMLHSKGYIMKPPSHVNVHGRLLPLKRLPMTAAGSLAEMAFHRTPHSNAYFMNIRDLRPGLLTADNKPCGYGWLFLSLGMVMGILLILIGIFFNLISFGVISENTVDWLALGLPGVFSILFGLGFLYMELSKLGFSRLTIKGRNLVIMFLSPWGRRLEAETVLDADDDISCYLREDAEQALFAVSVDMRLHKTGKTIVLDCVGVTHNDFDGAAVKAFERAVEISSNIGVRLHMELDEERKKRK